MNKYNGHYNYDKKIIEDWDSNAIGVYYCGQLSPANHEILLVHYVGKGTGEAGMRGRLLDHLRGDYWPDVTHFGFVLCDSVGDAENLEALEIKKWKPKYNTMGL